jgi:hypothetical protein
MVAGQALLEWTTTNETDNDFFTLSKSNDGKTFEAVTTVEPKGGAQSFKHSYTYSDPTPYKYYRISQTDHNGVVAHYRIVALSIPQVTMDDVTFYPTPFAGSLTIVANDASENNMQQLTLSDVLGKQVMKTAITQKLTTLSTDLPAGIYYYRLSDNHGNVRSGKLISAQ